MNAAFVASELAITRTGKLVRAENQRALVECAEVTVRNDVMQMKNQRASRQSSPPDHR
jgi:hypothetical protein